MQISESEYREYIRLKVTNDELEKITLKRIEEAVVATKNQLNKEWQEKCDSLESKKDLELKSLIKSFEEKGSIKIEHRDYSTRGYTSSSTTEIRLSSKDELLSNVIKDLGMDEIIVSEYDPFNDCQYPYHSLTYKGVKFYAVDAIESIEGDIRSVLARYNKIKQKMIDIRHIDPNIFDVLAQRSDTKVTTPKEIEDRVAEGSKSWWRAILKL